MRQPLLREGASELTYEIRGIVKKAHLIENLGQKISWENIGDPVAKGEKIPSWMKAIVSDLSMQDCSYSYCPTQGVYETREFLAQMNNASGGAHISPNDII